MKIGNYINDLLHYHDCVIVPDFGGFVTRYQSAAIHPVQHLFTPPSKSVAFNSELTTNDGLLANYICSRLLLTYPDACKIINDFVMTCKTQLDNNQRLVIDNVGELFYDVEKNLQFTPKGQQNFLLDSFGLAPVQSPAIQREKSFDIFDNQDASVVPAEKHKNYLKPLLRITAVTGIAALVAFAYFNPFISSKISKGIASIIPVVSRTSDNTPTNETKKVNLPVKEELRQSELNPDKNIYEEGAETSAKIPENSPSAETVVSTTQLPAQSVASENSSTPTITENKPENTLSVQEPLSSPAVAVTSPAPVENASVSNSDKVYFIIGGCFSVYENAQKLNSELQSKGYTSSLIGKNKNGLEMVAVTYFATLSEAEAGIQKIKNEGYADVWIYKGKQTRISN
ncbi:MAG TPA: SPOR domain-containing protein [Bacteroidia bacterium]|nr:SPOR domain-containing protein [Bacteroidia bacterium]MCB0849695.1 SPOR domain-containing protein [Bacteroidota bacterium]MBV6454885.1 hypothetical protein [Bacteroidia bacterium]MCB8930879.1 SPOR domain-containing protein [Bacteroidia bacterium]MCW5931454.1 SPOR domain-containing protein [Bacteroidota bacterium]